MSVSLSPELVLVLPEAQRAAAIQALPALNLWSPGPLGLPVHPARARHVLVGTALLYFATKLLWTLGTAALYVLAAVALVVAVTLLF